MQETIVTKCKKCEGEIRIEAPWPPVCTCPHCGAQYYLYYD